MVSTIIWGLVVGTILGVIGRMILPGKQNIPWWATIGAGIIAAVVGGIIATKLGVGETSGFDWIKHGIQVVLAVVCVWLVASLFKGRGTTAH